MLVDEQHWILFVNFYISELTHKRLCTFTVLVSLTLHLKVLRVEYTFFTHAIRAHFVDTKLAEILNWEE